MCRVQTLMTMLGDAFFGRATTIAEADSSPESMNQNRCIQKPAAIRLFSIAPPLSFHGSMVRYYFPHDTEGVRP
jgi:hypothetical protein